MPQLNPISFQSEIPEESYLTWKVYENVEGETAPRLLTPHSNPMLHEYPADGIFSTEDAAMGYLDNFDYLDDAIKEKWVLVRVHTIPVGRLS